MRRSIEPSSDTARIKAIHSVLFEIKNEINALKWFLNKEGLLTETIEKIKWTDEIIWLTHSVFNSIITKANMLFQDPSTRFNDFVKSFPEDERKQLKRWRSKYKQLEILINAERQNFTAHRNPLEYEELTKIDINLLSDYVNEMMLIIQDKLIPEIVAKNR